MDAQLSPVVVPLQLSCCEPTTRCLWCPPSLPLPVDTIEGLLVAYERRRKPNQELKVQFFGGPPPTIEQIDALRGRPFEVRFRPDLVNRDTLKNLIGRGCVGFEIDQWCFTDRCTKALDRNTPAKRTLEMLQDLHTWEVDVGVVLMPGLPESSFETCLKDARVVAQWAQWCRIHPLLVLANSGLRELHTNGQYEPLTLGEAITVCVEMVQILSPSVQIRRIGLQPAQDGFGRAVAGPRHPALHQLVSARLALATLTQQMAAVPAQSVVCIFCHPSDETATRGPLNQNIRTLRAQFNLQQLSCRPDPTLLRGTYRLTVER